MGMPRAVSRVGRPLLSIGKKFVRLRRYLSGQVFRVGQVCRGKIACQRTRSAQPKKNFDQDGITEQSPTAPGVDFVLYFFCFPAMCPFSFPSIGPRSIGKRELCFSPEV